MTASKTALLCRATAAARTSLPLLPPAEPLLPHLPPLATLLQSPSPLPQTPPGLPLLLLLRPAMVLLLLPTRFTFPLSLYNHSLLSPFCAPSPSVLIPLKSSPSSRSRLRRSLHPPAFAFLFYELRMPACGAFPLSPLPFSPFLCFIDNKRHACLRRVSSLPTALFPCPLLH